MEIKELKTKIEQDAVSSKSEQDKLKEHYEY